MKLSWERNPRRTKRQCANCGRGIPNTRFGDYFAAQAEPGAPQVSDLVCCMACGNELAHRIVRAVPGVLALLPPGDRSQWRDYKEGAPSRVRPR